MNTELTLDPQFNPQTETQQTRQRTLEQRQADGAKTALKVERSLGNPHPAATWQVFTRTLKILET